MTHLIHLHGFASSASGRKARYLRPRLAERSDATFYAVEFSPTPADFEYLTITCHLTPYNGTPAICVKTPCSTW